MIKTIANNPLLTVLVVLPLSILAKNLLGAGHGVQENKFDWQILKAGLFKGLLIYGGVGVITLIALISADFTVFIGGSELGLVEALIVVIGGASVVYIAETFEIMLKIWRQPSKEDVE